MQRSLKRRGLAAMAALAVVAAACTGGGGGGGAKTSSPSSNAPVTITMWHGYQDTEGREITKLVKEYESLHPNVHIKLTYLNNDYALQKVETAIAGGQPPDIAYIYGSWAANIAQSPKVVPLTSLVKSSSFNWNDFWPGERQAATVNGEVIGIPALVDNLALVYNKKLFQQAHIPFPTADWTWQDFTNAALKLTDPAKKQFGWAYVNDASEDTVWRYEALLWQAGGQILTSDNKHAAFDSSAGVAALTFLQKLANDHAIYLDNGNGAYAGLFNSGHIAMLYTGPWDLPSFTNADYGVQILPADVNHQTISGPDNWVLFDNGSARRTAAWNFLQWFTAPAQDADWIMNTCDLPIRQSVSTLPEYQTFLKNCPGGGTFVQNLQNVVNIRPVMVQYPKISEAIGQAVQSVLLGKSTPQQALSAAAQKVDQILAVPS